MTTQLFVVIVNLAILLFILGMQIWIMRHQDQRHKEWMERLDTYYRDRHRWTDEGREFVRRIDNACDGMISYGLTNANETVCLDWLRGEER